MGVLAGRQEQFIAHFLKCLTSQYSWVRRDWVCTTPFDSTST